MNAQGRLGLVRTCDNRPCRLSTVGKCFGRLPKGTMVTGRGTRIVWVYRNRKAQTASDVRLQNARPTAAPVERFVRRHLQVRENLFAPNTQGAEGGSAGHLEQRA